MPLGYYPETLMTKDLVPLEPKVSEHKFYAEGVGLVLALAHSGRRGSRGARLLHAWVLTRKIESRA